MLGDTNAQCPRGVDAETIQLQAQNATYQQNETIRWNLIGPARDWFTLNNDGTFTLKKGHRYLIAYNFTPTTTDTGISGIGYANAAVWKTSGWTQTYDLTGQTGTQTLNLYNNGNASTFVWFYMQIVRLVEGGGRKLISRILSFFGRCRR